MPNAKDIRPEDQYIRVLDYGDSGVGKSLFASTFPRPFVFDFDQGIKSMAGRDIEYETYTVGPYNKVGMDGKPDVSSGLVFDRFMNDMNRCFKMIAAGDIQTIVLDSITTYSEMLLKHIMHLAGKPEGAHPEIQHWGQQMNTIVSTINKLKGIPCNLVVIAHEQLEKDELTGALRGTPLVTGKLAGKLSLYFDEVYRSITEGGGLNVAPNYWLRTKSAMNFTAKSRLDGMLLANDFTGIPFKMVPDYEEIKRYVDQFTTGKALEVAKK